MPDLTKRESCLAITITVIALTGIAVTLWLLNQPSCWDKYSTEKQAIEMCEGKL